MSVTQASTAMPPPELNIDAYSDAVLMDSIPFQEALRESTVVYLPQYEAYAVGRQEQAAEVLKDHQRFTASCGIGLVVYHCVLRVLD